MYISKNNITFAQSNYYTMKHMSFFLLLCMPLMTIAQQTLVLPYDAASLTEEQRNANPDFVAYPASLLDDDSIPMRCIEPDCMEAIDLGLSIKWASCNVGAKQPEEYGSYFAWAETKPKTRYNWDKYLYCEGNATTLTKYGVEGATGCVDGKYELDAQDDAATANWGTPWRMPSEDEILELKNKCIWTYTTQNGVKGYLVTSKTNGNSIFLPAGGCMSPDAQHQDVFGNYWSSTLWLFDYYSQMGGLLHFTSSSYNLAGTKRCVGCLVRPVCL